MLLLRGLGLTYLMAFASLAVQVDGLIGRRGILPVANYLDNMRWARGREAYWELPTVFWLDASDRALHLCAWGGVVLAVMLLAGLLPGPCTILLWVGYLSLAVAGQEFLHFQWDSLLLEAGLLGLVIAPWSLRIESSRRDPSRLEVGLFRWLVFRLMFLSGVVKLTGGDPTWRAWEAMKYHYETQPLPTWTSWYVHQLPAWIHQASVGFMFWAELVAPFLMFGPWPARWIACSSAVLLQVMIAATGNYGFFNVLSIVLCGALLDDRDLGRVATPTSSNPTRPPPRAYVVVGVGVLYVLITAMEAIDRSGLVMVFPDPLERLRAAVLPFRSMNSYGLFAVMTTERPEILVEGSDDGVVWKPYRFRWKPGEPESKPQFATPHMPRLDWQMWFAALAPSCRSQQWFMRFELRLLEGSPNVLRLLREDPFPARPPRYIRATSELYRFTRRGQPGWWTSEPIGSYCPPIALPRAGRRVD
jgi:hypothetical protein